MLFSTLLPLSLAPSASAAPCVVGIPPPPPGGGTWFISNDTTISGCGVSFTSDILVLGGRTLSVSGTGSFLNTTGWINVSLGAVFDVSSGGEVHVTGGVPGVQLTLASGAILHVDSSTVELDSLSTTGLVNQANIEFRNATVTSRGFFNASANSVTIRSSVVNVSAPQVAAGQTGGDVVMRVGGRISADVSDSTFIARAASGGAGQQGGRGGDGGSATSVFDSRSLRYVSITVAGGSGGVGGRGASGASGGDGGLGGFASLTITSESVSQANVVVSGGGGGVGARGSDATSTSAGQGGSAKPGGAATLLVNAGGAFALGQSSFTATGGAGGSGGSGGTYLGISQAFKGGSAGPGAVGGAAVILVQGTNLAQVSYSALIARGGPGGLGGNYGAGLGTAPQTNGKAGTGGEGGKGIVRTNSSSLNLITDNSTVLAVGGGGGSGGNGGLEGGSGGDGGDGLGAGYGRFGVRISRSCYNATGGDGGPGSTGSLATGYGGRGGSSTVRINSSLGTVDIVDSCAGARPGPGGPAEPNRLGLAGIDDLYVNGQGLEVLDSRFGNSLDDYNSPQTGHLHNVTFDHTWNSIIPIGSSTIEATWDLDVYVHDGRGPLPGVTISITRCQNFTAPPFFQPGTTDSTGHYRTRLTGSIYTSDVTKASFIGCYSVETSFNGILQEPKEVQLRTNAARSFIYPTNHNPPQVTILQPRPQAYKVDKDHPNIELVIRIDDADDLITGVPTLFQVWACISREPVCFDRVDISPSRVVDTDTSEVRYSHSFNVSSVPEYPSGPYDVCAKASDGEFESTWRCNDITINQNIPNPPRPDLSAGRNARDTATKMVGFDGKVNNLEQLHNYTTPITILVYRWDFDGDGVWDFSSPVTGSTVHIYPQVTNVTTFHANFSVVDSLGREYSQPRDVTIDPVVYEVPNPIWTYAYVIAYSVLGIVGLTVAAYTVQRRRTRVAAEDAQRREQEILANIHECPRCGDLLPEKFAVCVHCATEDAIAGARKTVAELKQVGVIVLEEEDLIEKAAVSFEGRDFETANAFLDKVKARVEVNKKRHKQAIQGIRRERLYIKMLEQQGKDLTALEPEVYHAELALGRSDFDGAEKMVESIRKRIQEAVYEDRKRDVLERLTKLERAVKSSSAGSDEAVAKAADAMKLLERAKMSLGRKSYLEAVTYYTDAFTLFEGAPPETIVKEPTDHELDLFETRLKMQEEGVYLGPVTKAQGEEKVWRPGEKEFKIAATEDKVYRPGEGAKTMEETRAHGRDSAGEPPVAPAFVAPAAPALTQPPLADAPAPVPPGASFATASPAAAVTPAPAPTPAEPSTTPTVACAVCGTMLKPSWRKCPICGTPVPGMPPAGAPAPPAPPVLARPAAPAPVSPATAVAEKCPSCQKPVKPLWKKCPYCAAVLHG